MSDNKRILLALGLIIGIPLLAVIIGHWYPPVKDALIYIGR